MQVTTFTTYAEIRAALGVSDDELEDTTLALPMYGAMLAMELDDINDSIAETFTTLKELTSPTAAQSKFIEAAHIFATYAVARQLTTSLPMFSPEQITDGKAAIRRFSQDNPQARVIDAINKDYTRFKAKLAEKLAALSSSSSEVVARVYLAVSSPSVDPVVGS